MRSTRGATTHGPARCGAAADARARRADARAARRLPADTDGYGQTPAYHRGDGAELLSATREPGLESVVAKRLDSRYEAGRRSGARVKVEHTQRQELVVGGWRRGYMGRADRLGRCLSATGRARLLALFREGGHGLQRRRSRRPARAGRAPDARRV